jgi:hypothetical protein
VGWTHPRWAKQDTVEGAIVALIRQESTAQNNTTSSLGKQKMTSLPKKQQTPEALFEVEGECIVLRASSSLTFL